MGRLVEEHRELLLRSWHDYFTLAPRIEFNCDAMDVTFDQDMLRVHLVDDREIAIPLEYFPRLRDATPEQLAKWEIIGGAYGIHWEDLDEDISVGVSSACISRWRLESNHNV